MRLHALLVTAAAAVVAFVLFATAAEGDAATRGRRTAAAPKAVPGHLVLQVEGDASALQVTHITAKESGYNPTRTVSPYRVELLDAGGIVVGSYPLDLARFDMDPAHLGQGVTVRGCEVRDTRVAALVNVPFLENAASLRICSATRVLGTLAAGRMQTLVAEGTVR